MTLIPTQEEGKGKGLAPRESAAPRGGSDPAEGPPVPMALLQLIVSQTDPRWAQWLARDWLAGLSTHKVPGVVPLVAEMRRLQRSQYHGRPVRDLLGNAADMIERLVASHPHGESP